MLSLSSIIIRCRVFFHRKRVRELQDLQTQIVLATREEAKKHRAEFAEVLFRNSLHNIHRIELNIKKHQAMLRELEVRKQHLQF